MLRFMYGTIILMTAVCCMSNPAKAGLQDDIDAACSVGGTIQLPATLSLSQTLRLECPAGNLPLTLRGAPSFITCNTGGAPCITLGGSLPGEHYSRLNLSVRDIYLSGPGRTTAGSVGIQVLPQADDSSFDNIQINGFQKGMHLVGGSDILVGVRASNISAAPIFSNPPSVDIAVHLDGRVGNVFFTSFAFHAWSRAILSDGPGGTGASASFVQGRLNTTRVPGTASVYVTSNDGVVHDLSLSDVEDWETACPYLEVGHHGRVIVSNVAFTGDPQSSGTQPAVKVGQNASSVSWLRMNNVNLTYCSGLGNLVEVNSAATFTTITGSDLIGPVHFNAAGQGAFTGNRFVTSSCLTGSLGAVRAAANVNCPDR